MIYQGASCTLSSTIKRSIILLGIRSNPTSLVLFLHYAHRYPAFLGLFYLEIIASYIGTTHSTGLQLPWSSKPLWLSVWIFLLQSEGPIFLFFLGPLLCRSKSTFIWLKPILLEQAPSAEVLYFYYFWYLSKIGLPSLDRADLSGQIAYLSGHLSTLPKAGKSYLLESSAISCSTSYHICLDYLPFHISAVWSASDHRCTDIYLNTLTIHSSHLLSLVSPNNGKIL